jgi:pimeloyl-ACP methyl ester carboxylesterase
VRRADGGDRRIDVGDLAFRVWGVDRIDDGIPAVVLIHGIGVSHRYLACAHNTLRALTHPRRVAIVSIDLPGHGGLPKPRRDADIARIADALGEVLDRCGLGAVVLAGHSMGAQWVTELALRRPDRAPGVVLIGPVADARHRSFFAQSRALAVDTLRESPPANVVVFTDYLRCGMRWYLRQSRHMLTYPLEQRVGSLRMPTLVLRGDRDPIAGDEWCRGLAVAAPRGAVGVIPGGPHVIQDAQPEAVAAALILFADGVGIPCR